MSWTFNSKAFTLDSYVAANAALYYGPAHTLSLKDDLRLGKVAPKPTTVFSGVGRSSFKLTRTLTLTGAETPTGDAIIDINISAPVGAAGADLDTLVTDVAAAVAHANFKLIVKNLAITY